MLTNLFKCLVGLGVLGIVYCVINKWIGVGGLCFIYVWTISVPHIMFCNYGFLNGICIFCIMWVRRIGTSRLAFTRIRRSKIGLKAGGGTCPLLNTHTNSKVVCFVCYICLFSRDIFYQSVAVGRFWLLVFSLMCTNY